MDDRENRKSNEALPDEALEDVAGGGLGRLAQGAIQEGMRPMDRAVNRKELPDEKAWIAVTAQRGKENAHGR